MKHAILELHPAAPVAGTVLGELWLNGKFFCWALERAATARPAGAHVVQLSRNPAGGQLTPHLAGTDVRLVAAGGQLAGHVQLGLARMPCNTVLYKGTDAFERLMSQLLNYDTIDLTVCSTSC